MSKKEIHKKHLLIYVSTSQLQKIWCYRHQIFCSCEVDLIMIYKTRIVYDIGDDEELTELLML